MDQELDKEIFIAKKICFEMLEQRGYTNIIEDDISEELKIYADNSDKKIVIFFCYIPKLNKQKYQEYLEFMDTNQFYHSIIVYRESVTPEVKKCIDIIQQESIYIELFCIKDMQCNITKHVLQPIFKRINQKEMDTIKTQFGLKFPCIKKDDPIAKFYDFRKGELIEVINKITGIVEYRIIK